MRRRFLLLKSNARLEPEQREILDRWLAAHPRLAAAYRAKEGFYAIWRSRSKRQALRKYRRWLRRLDTQMMDDFAPLIGALEKWEEEIFAYFDHQVTNAFTESRNNIIQLIKRNERGYSFKVIRAKILFGATVQRDIQRYSWRHGKSESILRSTSEGIDMDSLVKLLSGQWLKRESTRDHC